MGRVEEAETALNQALEKEPENSTALANKFVLDTVAGKDASGSRSKVKGHEVLVELEAKREAFRQAMGKYSPKFEP